MNEGLTNVLVRSLKNYTMIIVEIFKINRVHDFSHYVFDTGLPMVALTKAFNKRTIFSAVPLNTF